MAKVTLGERRFQLTEKVKAAREEYHAIRNRVQYEVRKANPGLKEGDWVTFWDKVDNDPRVLIADARLLALCDAANIMGAEIE